MGKKLENWDHILVKSKKQYIFSKNKKNSKKSDY